jgi:acyl carrier protein
MNARQRLQKIIEGILADPEIEYSEELSMANCGEWDSVATVQIVLALEQEFNVRFTTNEVAGVQGVRDLLQLLRQYGVPTTTFGEDAPS